MHIGEKVNSTVCGIDPHRMEDYNHPDVRVTCLASLKANTYYQGVAYGDGDDWRHIDGAPWCKEDDVYLFKLEDVHCFPNNFQENRLTSTMIAIVVRALHSGCLNGYLFMKSHIPRSACENELSCHGGVTFTSSVESYITNYVRALTSFDADRLFDFNKLLIQSLQDNGYSIDESSTVAGFDTSHYMDVMPAMRRISNIADGEATYKNLPYLINELAHMKASVHRLYEALGILWV